ncbi:MAG TPA: PEGA domain-containing protein [Candidatus Sulfotelmatobacter sp.]|nr:PEGA domain-containing protein [Candidatus Sulfotelmatobacter sp.]
MVQAWPSCHPWHTGEFCHPGDASTGNSHSGPASATLAVGSGPAGTEIYLDGQLLSFIPASVEVTAANHQLTLKLAGHQDWTRNIHVLPATATHFEPALAKK